MNSPSITIWLGYDTREATAFAIAKYSIQRYNRVIPVFGLVLDDLRKQGLYYRPTRIVDGGLWDDISDAPMSTEFAISRFLVPHLAKNGLALFADSDIIFRRNPSKLFDIAAGYLDKAVMVVKHNYEQKEGIKMDGQKQTVYPRKNWSSVMMFNCDHPANKALTVSYVNEQAGRDLHRFCWLTDDQIGELPSEWNYCVGHSRKENEPAIVHFTEGLPDLRGYENQEYANEWNDMRPYAVGALFGRVWR